MPKRATKRSRGRKTEAQIIADLEAETRRLRAWAAAKEAKSLPEGKALLTAVKAIDKALEAAKQAKDDKMAKALEAARAPLSKLMVEMGLRVPQRRRRRTRRGSEAA